MASFAMIAAVARNGVIGQGNRLPWHLPEDLRWFKDITLNKPLIMGRKTFDSLERPLPGRPHVVVSRDTDYRCEGATLVTSIAAAKATALCLAEERGAEQVMVVGGAEIYRQMLPAVDIIYRTLIDLAPEGDTYFPELGSDWVVRHETQKIQGDISFFFQTVVKNL